MAFIKYIDSAYELHDEFEGAGRGYFSIEACQEMINYCDECGEDIELDVIALCCEWTEYEPGDLAYTYKNVLSFEEYCEDEGLTDDDGNIDSCDDFWYDYIEELAKHISQSMTIFTLDNGNYLVADF